MPKLEPYSTGNEAFLFIHVVQLYPFTLYQQKDVMGQELVLISPETETINPVKILTVDEKRSYL